MVFATDVELLDQQELLEVVLGVVVGAGVVVKNPGPLADRLVLLLQEDSLVPMIGLVQCESIYMSIALYFNIIFLFV